MAMQDLAALLKVEESTEAVVLRLADVAGGGLGWLWPGRIPMGKLTMLVGDPGLGKSLIALDVAARVTRGLPWPDAADSGNAPQGRVVLMSAEDEASDTIRPRLEALGGDPKMMAVLQTLRRPGKRLSARIFSLARDLAPIAESICQRGDVKLFIIDPLNAFFGGREGGNNAATRAALLPLQAMAECSGAAVLAIGHLNKRTGGSILYRTQGNLAYVATSRSVWGTVPDPDAPGRRLLLPLKCNLAGAPAGLAYRVVPCPASPAVPVVAWEPGAVLANADEVMARAAAPTVRQEAARWLKELLACGAMPYRLIAEHAREVGFTPTAVRQAKRDLGAVHYHEGYATRWLWRLAEQATPRDEAGGAATSSGEVGSAGLGVAQTGAPAR